MKVFLETLLYIIKEDKVLLIEKKRGLGRGYFNGVGGKVEIKRNEDPIRAVIREAKEEIGIVPKGLKFSGLLEFWNEEDSVHYVYVFTSSDYEGNLTETEEAKPIWFDLDEIPYGNMWEDDKYWLPLVLNGKKIYGRFFFKDWKLMNFELYSLEFSNHEKHF